MFARTILALISIMLLLTARPVFAEIKIFEKDLEEIVSNDQSREQVEAFTLQKAKRLAIEEAGTYIQSLTVVQNYQLTKDEVTALSSGVVQAKIIGVPEVLLVNGVIHVKVKARIQVDTSILDKQIAEIMKEKSTLKKLAEEQAKVKELEGKLSTLKSSELKRLEELNAQAAALEQEREKQRLFLEEQRLKAQGELNKAEIERLQKERELVRLINEQEIQRKQEAAALANEQDRIRRAQMENEQHWSDLVRKSQRAQQNWVVIDDSLSLKAALEELRLIKQELASMKKRMEYQSEENVKTLNKAYALQIEFTKPKLPPPLKEKDPFETTEEYATRRTTYELALKSAEAANAEEIERLTNEENVKVLQAKMESIEQSIKLTAPFIERLKALQKRQFVLPGEQVAIELGTPNADRSCFPSTIKYKEKTWTVDWKYIDRNKARDIYNTRTYLKAEALVQLDDTKKEGYMMTAARVTHPGTGEQAVLPVANVEPFTEIKELNENSSKVLAEYKEKLTTANNIIEHRKQYFPSASQYEMSRDGATVYDTNTGLITSRKAHEAMIEHRRLYLPSESQFEFSRDGDSVYDTKTGLIWAKDANMTGRDMNWNDAVSWVTGITIGGLKGWRLPTKEELESLARAGGQSPATWLNSIGFSNALVALYWSSTTDGSKSFAWVVSMENGNMVYVSRTYNSYVWPVRSGQ